MWSPVVQQVMIPSPGQPTRRYGIGAVDYHSGQTFVLIEKRKKWEQIALFLEALLAESPDKIFYIAWGNADTHSGGKDGEVVWAAGRLVLLYLPTYSPGSTLLRCSGGTL